MFIFFFIENEKCKVNVFGESENKIIDTVKWFTRFCYLRSHISFHKTSHIN